ncbi:MAG: hypothetical protein COV59_02270 [Candidatus Magasanikbacteria bacterium CG11_big_fil_rev_8_21_14_0_20_39_34]|uniref:8-oxo-dGTP diphosphatase n=1 Tax=Candidatus Magasanikbacteria bacterium CG11_big_fil_rev_8_21_14_0_20_39_34 TaxID=1974653 RepID=A0A2H0N5T8_9BACT|nr:MAG: hypothetical protein COV59_02270 [Candidatus Magasanikbacteria bacterium CG11_big_fil_rev_8_21_14_0_20_39_34]
MEYDGEFIILLRNSEKPDGNTWGLPAGKIDSGETPLGCIVREIKEETGYTTEPEELKFLGKYEYSFPEFNLVFFTYKLCLQERIKIVYSEREHRDWMYVSADNCYSMKNLVRGLHDVIKRTGYIK